MDIGERGQDLVGAVIAVRRLRPGEPVHITVTQVAVLAGERSEQVWGVLVPYIAEAVLAKLPGHKFGEGRFGLVSSWVFQEVDEDLRFGDQAFIADAFFEWAVEVAARKQNPKQGPTS
jgi:hypothetical protein